VDFSGSARNRQEPAKTSTRIRSSDFLGRILGIFRQVPARNGPFPEGFSPEIHGILLPESSTWVFMYYQLLSRTIILKSIEKDVSAVVEEEIGQFFQNESNFKTNINILLVFSVETCSS
jgi:hypothetical protein